jgi:SAM-dependent methyltransferase
VGLDYSPRMIEQSRRLLGEDDRIELVVGDARDLSPIDGSFDFVLFSFNGIDAVGHEDRLKILSEVRRVLKPDGMFLFSAHSLGALPLTTKRPRSRRGGSRLLEAYHRLGDMQYAWGVRRSNRTIDLDTARRRGWTVIRDVAHDFSLSVYYVAPLEQLEQLRAAGLEVIAVYDEDSREVDPLQDRRDPWLNYLCRPLQSNP